MKMSAAFPSKYLKASDLQGRAVKLVIKGVELEEVGDGHKPVVYFEGKEKGVVLNKTNGSMIASLYGDDTDMWAGKEIEVFPDKTPFQGQIVDCLRVRGIAPVADELDDSIPF